jgi:hypothetical protein
LAIRTQRPTRENLYSAVYYDDRSAPKTATRYCKTHGLALMADMIATMVDGDDTDVPLLPNHQPKESATKPSEGFTEGKPPNAGDMKHPGGGGYQPPAPTPSPLKGVTPHAC